MSARVELETAIEKEVHNLVFKISEHVHDFTHLYMRRNNIPVDQEQLKLVLKVVEMAIKDGELRNIDGFHAKIASSLEKEIGVEENAAPFTKTESKKEEQELKISFPLS